MPQPPLCPVQPLRDRLSSFGRIPSSFRGCSSSIPFEDLIAFSAIGITAVPVSYRRRLSQNPFRVYLILPQTKEIYNRPHAQNKQAFALLICDFLPCFVFPRICVKIAVDERKVRTGTFFRPRLSCVMGYSGAFSAALRFALYSAAFSLRYSRRSGCE